MSAAMNAATWPGQQPQGLEAFMPRPPSRSKPLPEPAKMAKPVVAQINSFAVKVTWTPPVDLHLKRKRIVLASAGRDIVGSQVSDAATANIQGFRIRYSSRALSSDEMPHCTLSDQAWPHDAQEALFKWLPGGTEYIFEVAAFNASGQGPWSDGSEPLHMPLDHNPEPRRGPNFLSLKPDSIEIQWQHPCHRGSKIQSYDILCCEDSNFGGEGSKQLSIPGDSTVLKVDNLRPNTVYYFKYRAVNAKGASAWSMATEGAATAAVPPSRPGFPIRLGGEASWKSTEVNVTWDAPECFNLPVQNYRLRWSLFQDMRNPVEVTIGSSIGVPIDQEGKKLQDDTLALATPRSATAPLTPGSRSVSTPRGNTTPHSGAMSTALRRPGFSKGGYALTQLKVKGLMPSTEYYFQVLATNQVGDSPWSPPSYAMRTTHSTPGRCEKPRYIRGDRHGGMHIFWPVPLNTGGLPIAQYDVRMSEHAMMKGTTEFHKVTVKPHSIAFRSDREFVWAVISGAWDPGIPHFYQVRVVTSAGIGEWSESSDEMQTEAERPARPDPPHTFDRLPRAIVVHWKEPDSLGTPITGYQLRYDTSADMASPTKVRGMSGVDREFAVVGLHPHYSYFFQIRAENGKGVSEWSRSSRPVAVLQTTPQKMAAPQLVGQSPTSLIIGCTPPADTGTRDGDLLQSYTLVYAGGNDRYQRLAAKIGHEDSTLGANRQAKPSGTEVKGLTPGSPYVFQVYGVNEFGDGEPSDVCEFTTSAAAPDPPMAPAMSEFTCHSVTVSFQLGSDNGSKIIEYSLEVEDLLGRRSCQAGERWELEPFLLNPDKFDGQQYQGVHHLLPGSDYRIRARTMNSEGTSLWSEPSTICKTMPQPPDPVITLAVQEVNSTSMTVSWEPPHDHGDAITEYILQWTDDEKFTGASKEKTVPSTERIAILGSITPGSVCYARVAAGNGYGRGKFGPGVDAKTKADLAPPPGRPRCVTVGPTWAKVSWLVPFDNGDPIVNFWLRYEETETDGRPYKDRDRGEALVEGRKHFCVIEPLFSEREYIWEVAAENGIGLGKYSEASEPCRIGVPGVPTIPSVPKLISTTMTTVVVRWNASETNGTEVEEQVVRISTSPDFEEGSYRDVPVPKWELWMTEKLEAEGAIKKRNPPKPSPYKTEPVDPVAEAVQADPQTGQVDPGTPGLPKRPVKVADTRESMSKNVLSSQGFGAETLFLQMGKTDSTGASEADTERLALEKKRNRCRRAHGGNRGISYLMERKNRHERLADYTVPGCAPGTGFYIKVAAKCRVGLSDWGPMGKLMSTEIGIPWPISQEAEAGISLIRAGCTTLTFGWERPYCNGAPITHYKTRCALTEEGLWQDGCFSDEREEFNAEVWPGMQHPRPEMVREACLQNESLICDFVEYLMIKFGSLQQSWEWLDVNNDRDISNFEFIEGDIDSGPPFPDYKNQETLKDVWEILDSDGSGSIGRAEWDKLMPYLRKVEMGKAGTLPGKGSFSMIRCLIPGKSYYFMAKAVNKAGESEWTKAPGGPFKTEGMVPAQTVPLWGVQDMRTTSSVTFRWELPDDSGEPLTDIEIRYAARFVEDRLPDRRDLREGVVKEFDADLHTGELPTEVTLSGFKPGQVVFAIARAFNQQGGARRWSDLPGPGHGDPEDLITWDCATLPAPPDQLKPPVIDVDSLVVKNSVASGAVSWETAGHNGMPICSFELRILDPTGEIVDGWEQDADGPLGLVIGRKCCGRFSGLAAGEQYMLKVRAKSLVGISPWSETSELVRMPPDIPQGMAAPLSEFTSLKWIELKFCPPHHNGAPIEEYDMAYALSETATDDEFTHQDPGKLAEEIKEHGYDGRRTVKRDRGSLLAKIYDLEELKIHYFRVRARNAVGWGPWSDVTGYRLKAVRPSKVKISGMTVANVGQQEISIEWKEPEINGAPIERYDVISAPSVRMLRWAHLTQILLGSTVDTDKLFGYELVGGVQIGDQLGLDGCAGLRCEETVWAPLKGDCRRFDIERLLPGQDYYFSVRATNMKGKGEFSEILGPITTAPQRSDFIEPAEITEVSETFAKFVYKLPYNYGAKFNQAVAILERCSGPLSAEELHPETQEPHERISRREWRLSLQAPAIHPPKVGDGRWIPGNTEAVKRSYRDQGAEGHFGQWHDHIPSLINPTNFKYEVNIDGLIPGTEYQVSFRLCNQEGWTPYSPPTKFLTESTVPDMPGPLFVASA